METSTTIRVVDIDRFDRLNSLMTVEITITQTTTYSWLQSLGGSSEKSLKSTFTEQFLRVGEPGLGAWGKWYRLKDKKVYTQNIPLPHGGKLPASWLEDYWIPRYAEHMLKQRRITSTQRKDQAMSNSEPSVVLDAAVKRVQEEEEKRVTLLRAMNSVLNLSQDIEDVYNDEDLKAGEKLRKMLDKGLEIQRIAATILPG